MSDGGGTLLDVTGATVTADGYDFGRNAWMRHEHEPPGAREAAWACDGGGEQLIAELESCNVFEVGTNEWALLLSTLPADERERYLHGFQWHGWESLFA